eukprot:COSAG06_NODE_3014_length_5960_cov_2.963146_1_plen_1145_part_00
MKVKVKVKVEEEELCALCIDPWTSTYRPATSKPCNSENGGGSALADPPAPRHCARMMANDGSDALLVAFLQWGEASIRVSGNVMHRAMQEEDGGAVVTLEIDALHIILTAVLVVAILGRLLQPMCRVKRPVDDKQTPGTAQLAAERTGFDAVQEYDGRDPPAAAEVHVEPELPEPVPELSPVPELQMVLHTKPTSERLGIKNEPGRWDIMISYTQRNPVSETLAAHLHGEFVRRGLAVWLDIKMDKRDEAAMEEGVRNSSCVVAIVSGAAEGQSEDTAYFQRDFCLKELRWAVAAGVFVQPIVAAEDKGQISEMMQHVPADLAHLKGVNWEHIDRKDKDYFELGVTKILEGAQISAPEAGELDRARSPREQKLAQHLEETLDLDSDVAEQRAQALIEGGYNTPGKYETLSLEQLVDRYGFREIDLFNRLIATAIDAAAASVVDTTNAAEPEPELEKLELEARLQGGAMKIPVKLPDGSTHILEVDQAMSMQEIEAQIVELGAHGLRSAVQDSATGGVATKPQSSAEEGIAPTPLEQSIRDAELARELLPRTAPLFWAPQREPSPGQTPGQTAPAAAAHTLPQEAAGPFDMNRLNKSPTWAEAARHSGHSDIVALAHGVSRFLFWHATQPLVYFISFGIYAANGTLVPLQLVAGWWVAVREGVYLLSVLVCAYLRPAFLLVDIGASGYGIMAMYSLAPDKFMLMVLSMELDDGELDVGELDGNGIGIAVISVVLGCLEFMAVPYALGAGLGAHDLPWALLLSYSVAALSAVWLVLPMLLVSVAIVINSVREDARKGWPEGAKALVFGTSASFYLFCAVPAFFWMGFRDAQIHGLRAECGNSLAFLGQLPCGNTTLADTAICSAETQAVVDAAYTSCGDLFQLYFKGRGSHWDPFRQGFWQDWNENACAEEDWDDDIGQCSPTGLLDLSLSGFVYEPELDFEQNFANTIALVASIAGSCGCGTGTLELPASFATEQTTEHWGCGCVGCGCNTLLERCISRSDERCINSTRLNATSDQVQHFSSSSCTVQLNEKQCDDANEILGPVVIGWAEYQSCMWNEDEQSCIDYGATAKRGFHWLLVILLLTCCCTLRLAVKVYCRPTWQWKSCWCLHLELEPVCIWLGAGCWCGEERQRRRRREEEQRREWW